jgi:hypothetical protein
LSYRTLSRTLRATVNEVIEYLKIATARPAMGQRTS